MKSFDELGLSDALMQAVRDLGYETPMPVQEAVIPLLLEEDTDLMALAQTGTGKTAAFGLPLLQKTDTSSRLPQLLVLCPTRELCVQISGDLCGFAKHIDGFHLASVYGGAGIRGQIVNLRKGVSVVVATPGRLLDLVRRGEADLSAVRYVVMDEADEMLDMGFSEDIDAILSEVPAQRHIMLFSATMPDSIAAIVGRYMTSPREIVIGSRNEGASNVRHICYMVQAKDKYRTLKRIIDYCPGMYGIIFCRTKAETQEVAEGLIRDGYSADSLHGDLAQAQRDYVMRRFRLHGVQMLVATDVAARGLDVDDLTHIINYTLPDETEVYTHRSGRTGRAGKSGVSIAIINLRERRRIRDIERTIGKTFEQGRIPTGEEICSRQVFNLVDRIEHQTETPDSVEEILPSVLRRLSWLDKDDLVRRILSMETLRIASYYADDKDFETVPEGKPRKVEVGRTEGYVKVFVGIGRMDRITPKMFLGLLNDSVGDKVPVGRIDIFTRYTLVDVPEPSAGDVIAALSTLRMKGRQVKAYPATDEQISRGGRKR